MSKLLKILTKAIILCFVVLSLSFSLTTLPASAAAPKQELKQSLKTTATNIKEGAKEKLKGVKEKLNSQPQAPKAPKAPTFKLNEDAPEISKTKPRTH